MSDKFIIYDAKVDLFLGYNYDSHEWAWITLSEVLAELISNSVGEESIEVFLDNVRNNEKDFDFNEDFIKLSIAAIPNVWLIRITGDSVDYTDGIKI